MPVQRSIMRQDGIAKATLELMVQNPRNDMDAARLGLVPVVPEGTTFDLDISGGHARVDMSAQVLNAQDKQQEENMRTAIVWALTEFDTVKDVHFLVDGRKPRNAHPRNEHRRLLYARRPEPGSGQSGNVCGQRRNSSLLPDAERAIARARFQNDIRFR